MQKIKYIQNIVTLERRIINGTYGWLLLASAALSGYCLIVMCSKTEKFTDIGKWTFVFAVIGLIYSIMTISGFDVRSLF